MLIVFYQITILHYNSLCYLYHVLKIHKRSVKLSDPTVLVVKLDLKFSPLEKEVSGAADSSRDGNFKFRKPTHFCRCHTEEISIRHELSSCFCYNLKYYPIFNCTIWKLKQPSCKQIIVILSKNQDRVSHLFF